MSNSTPNKNATVVLHQEDTINQTIGCRHNYPNLCKNNNAISVCAFVRKDGKCLKPPFSWKKLFPILVSNECK